MYRAHIAWHENAMEAKARRNKLRRAVGVWQQRLKAMGFHGWRFMLSERARLVRVAERAVLRMAHVHNWMHVRTRASIQVD